MATNVFTSRFTARQVETALERALTAVQSINGQQPGGSGDVFMEELRLEKGEPATLEKTLVRYAASPSGSEVPAGSWSETVPPVHPGYCLWTRITLIFNSGEPVEFYSVSRMGVDSSVSVCAALSLPASGWVGLEQTVSAEQVTESASVTVAPEPGSEDNYRSYLESAVRCVSQGAGTLTFRCGQVPDRDLTVNVRIDGLSAAAPVRQVRQTAVLARDLWYAGKQTLQISGLTEGTMVSVAAARDSQAEYARCAITCTAQAGGTLTFLCTAVPTTDLTVEVEMLI